MTCLQIGHDLLLPSILISSDAMYAHAERHDAVVTRGFRQSIRIVPQIRTRPLPSTLEHTG